MPKSLLFILFSTLLLIQSNTYGQDSTRSLVYKPEPFQRKSHPVIKSRYPSYSLINGYRLLEKVKEDDPLAQHELGLRYLLGIGFPKDTTNAVKMIKLAADKNLTSARFNYAIMLSNNVGIEWNPFMAFSHIKFAAEKGMPVAQYAYALQFTDNLVVNRNLDTAYKWLKLAETGGHDKAPEVIEQLIANGFVPSKQEDSFLFNSQASGRNFKQEQNLISRDWEVDFIDFESDSLLESDDSNKLEEFLDKDVFKIGKSIGITDSSLILSDTVKSIDLIKEASANGSPEALLLYARLLEKGVKTDKNNILAVEKYIRSLRLGSFKAVDRILELIKIDDFFESLKNEVDRKNANAMYVWAGLTALGFDFRLTNDQALDLLKEAAEMNHIASIIEIGLCFSSGTLVEKNLDMAEEFWNKAKNLGSREAKVRLAMLAIFDKEKSDLKKEIDILINAKEEGIILAVTALGYCYEIGRGVKKDKSKAVRYYRLAAGRGSETSFNALKRMYDDLRPEDDIFQIISLK